MPGGSCSELFGKRSGWIRSSTPTDLGAFIALDPVVGSEVVVGMRCSSSGRAPSFTPMAVGMVRAALVDVVRADGNPPVRRNAGDCP
ncbi:MAG: hypothetical protein B7Y49_02060 [Sphingomonas sp. 28-62-11]|nr:MAG: hypothetical protein B7Y49_02060 [Sphingomonas sp. 28-62-11]